jgi:hypothetical protein
MKTALFIARFTALFAASAALASVAAPAFASNDGPAPFYRPSVSDARPVAQAANGSAASVMTTASDDADADADNARQSYGGMSDGSSQADARQHSTPWQRGLFAHH